MGQRYNPDNIMDGMFLCLDAADPLSYGGSGYARNLINTWVDYGSNQANYVVQGNTKSNHSILIKNTYASWIGYFPATTTEYGYHTIEFTYVSDTGSTVFVLDNDGIYDNNYNGTYTATTTPQKGKVTVNLSGSSGDIRFYFRRDSGNAVTISNVNFYRSDVWYDRSGYNNHFLLHNPGSYTSTGPKYMDFNGTYSAAYSKSGSDVGTGGSCSAIVWTRIKTDNSNWRTLFRAESGGANHHVIVQAGDYNIGMYDNDGGSGFNSTGFSQQSLPGWNSSSWNMLVWRWASTSYSFNYYTISYNDSPSTIRGYISSSNARFKTGFKALGCYNSGSPSQFWGDIGHLSMYNRYISDDEVLRHYYARRERFGK